jgi:OOP family OmpA-OmpF porin
MKKFAAIALSLGVSTTVFAAKDETYVTVLGDYLVHPSSNHAPQLKNGYGLDARYGAGVDDRWGYEVGAFYDPWKAKTGGSGYHSGVGADAMFKFGNLWSVTPFLLGGVGIAYSDLVSGTRKDPHGGLMLDFGGGVMTGELTTLFGRALNARVQAKANYEHYEKGYLDVRLYAGVQLALSAPAPAAPAPEKIEVVPPVAPVAEPAAAPEPAPVREAVTSSTDEGTVNLETAKEGDKIVLHGVNFETAKAKLTPNAKTILDGVAEQIAKRPELMLEISGHTDSVGKTAYNQNLSERRAQAVVDYLVSKGIDATHLTAVGYGKTQPIDTNDTDEGREKNRRVELRITR